MCGLSINCPWGHERQDRPTCRLALPGNRVRLVWVSGDATPTIIATVDWTHQRFARNLVADFLETLAQVVGGEAHEGEIIAVAELLNLVTFAAASGKEWER